MEEGVALVWVVQVSGSSRVDRVMNSDDGVDGGVSGLDATRSGRWKKLEKCRNVGRFLFDRNRMIGPGQPGTNTTGTMSSY